MRDSEGYGILTVNYSLTNQLQGDVKYADLSVLGNQDSYFAVHNASSIAITPDGRYGFVMGSNNGPFLKNGRYKESVDGVQAGSSIGIILDPLTDPQLVAATRPVPTGFGKGIAISNDGRYLYAAHPINVGTFVYNIEEIEKTLANPENYIIDGLDRGEGSRFFNRYPYLNPGDVPPEPRGATFADFRTVPIDDIILCTGID